MLSLGKMGTKETPVPIKGRALGFWISRFVIVGAAAAAIVFGVVWWSDRPLAEAEASLKRGDVKYAHYLLSNYLDEHPAHQRATALMARVYVALGDPDQALTLFDQSGAATTEDFRAWARAYMMTEQWSMAVPLLEFVEQNAPEDAEVLYELTACRVRLGMFEEALESAQRLARLPGQEARGHMFVGAILRDLGKEEEAAIAFETVLKYDPKAENLQAPAAEFFLQYGQTLLRMGKPEEALEPLKRSAAAKETPEVLFELGNAALRLQRVEDAKVAWERALELDERHLASREALARAALQQSQPQEALDWLSPLAEKDATLESAYLRQRAYTLLGNDEEARQWQESAAELRKKQELDSEVTNLLIDAPHSFWARVIRAHRFAEQGNWRQAELMTQALIQEAPAEPFVIELTNAVHRRGELPSMESLPVTHY